MPKTNKCFLFRMSKTLLNSKCTPPPYICHNSIVNFEILLCSKDYFYYMNVFNFLNFRTLNKNNITTLGKDLFEGMKKLRVL